MAQDRKTAIDREIDQNIKRAFEDLSNEPVPERFTRLLDQLKQRGSAGGGTETAEKKGGSEEPPE